MTKIKNILLYAILIITGLFSIYLRAPYFKTPLLIVDEALYSEVAMQFMDGEFEYKNNKPPVIFFLYSAVFSIFGKGNIQAVEKLAAITVVLSGFLLFFIVARLSGRKAGVIAAVTYMILPSLSNSPSNFYAANTEIFLVFSELTAILCFLIALRGKPLWFFVSGVFCGLNMFIKQPGILILPMLVLFLIVTRLRPKKFRSWKEISYGVLALSGGSIAICCAFFLFFKANGALDDLIYNMFTVNKMYFEKQNVFLQGIQLGLEITLNRYVRNNYLIYLPAVSQLVMFMFSAVKNFRKENFSFSRSTFFILWTFVSVYCLSLGWRFSGHYYYMVFPVLAGLFGIFWQGISRYIKNVCGRAVKTYYIEHTLLGAIIVLSLLYPLTYYTGFPPGSKRYITYLESDKSIGKNIRNTAYYIIAHTLKPDTIFVWGYCPEIYHLSRRRCASMFAHCDYLVGEVDPYPEGGRMDRVNPQHWKIFLHELLNTKPAYIIDISPSNYLGFASNRIDKYPLSIVISENYDFDKQIGNFDLYRLKK